MCCAGWRGRGPCAAEPELRGAGDWRQRAISGVMGAYLMKFPASRVTTLVFFLLTVEVPAMVMIGWWFVTQLFSGLGSLAATNPQAGARRGLRTLGALWRVVC